MTAVAVLAGGLLLAGCGDEAQPAQITVDEGAPTPVEEVAPSPTRIPRELTCPSGEMVGTAGGYYAELPDGFDTPEEAVEDWLAGWGSRYDNGAGYVVTRDGSGAFVLREDGTASARVDFLRHQGFTAHGYEACTD